ncbi:hypothetical protein BG015_002972, partial [Linnemannia schmuckeri]
TQMAQVCWLVFLNRGLVDLRLNGIPLLDRRVGQLLAGVIAGLSKLRRLEVLVHCVKRGDDWMRLWPYLFFACPPSIQKLRMIFEDYQANCGVRHSVEEEEVDDDDGEYYETNYGYEPKDMPHWEYYLDYEMEEEELEEDEGGMSEDLVVPAVAATSFVRRQEPLSNLEELFFHGMHGYHWDSLTDLRSMFTHCPNIKKLNTYVKAGDEAIKAMGQFIAKTCPKIEVLEGGSFQKDSRGSEEYRILTSLPAQQVIHVELIDCPLKIIDPAFNIKIQQHSIILREIHIGRNRSHVTISASTILKECSNLEALFVPFSINGYYITLDDALRSPWVCTKLQTLMIAISGCDLPVEREVLLPYYLRPPPITLSETYHFSQLEDLYQQIGTLTSLKDLNLRMVPLKANGQVDERKVNNNIAMSFPAMLSVGDTYAGRPGFLNHLSGLKKLETLRGSFSAETYESEKTIEWPEVVWMDQNWPLLRHAEFFSDKNKVTPPFKWLKSKRRNGRPLLRIVAGYESSGEIGSEDDDVF